MTEFKCEYCDFSTKKIGTLNKHQKSTKYCLKKQQQIQQSQQQLTCEYCNKILSRADSLIRHQQTCIDYLLAEKEKAHSKEIETLKSIIDEKNRELKEKDQLIWKLTNMTVTASRTNTVTIDNLTVHTDAKTVQDIINTTSQLKLEN